jgi:ring-1,2-phenylacetyl-CoA epoxidase subunit PaaD
MSAVNKHITHNDLTETIIWDLMKQIYDPEIPVISIVDLGIVRKVVLIQTGIGDPKVTITITPTYSGCPAMDVITMNIRMKLLEHGFKNFDVNTILSPAWTTDWMNAAAKEKLRAYGIAPPENSTSDKSVLMLQQKIKTCPRCGSEKTEMISAFGSTACKALYRCKNCGEPFDYFKCH